MPQYSDTELLEILQHVGERLGHPPSINEFRDEDDVPSVMTYFNRFGSWRHALEEAGFDSRPPQEKIPREDLLEEIHRLADELGERPSAAQMDNEGKYWVSTYTDRFGSWRNALEAAGFEIPDHLARTHVSESDLIKEILRLEGELGKRPTYTDMERQGRFAASTYERHFGSWSKALEKAGFDANREVTHEKLLEDLRELAETLGKRPTMQEMNERGTHSPNTYVQYFGSWSDAVDLVMKETEAE